MDMENPFAVLDKTDDGDTPTPSTPLEASSSGDQVDIPAQGEEEELDFDFGDFGDLNLALDEEDFVQKEYRPYQMPADGAYIPVRINSNKLGKREMKVLLTDPITGEDIVKERAMTPRFEMEVEHVAEIYGSRRWDLNLNVPIPDIRIPFRRGGELRTFDKQSGRNFLAASRTLPHGETLTKTNIKKVIDESHGRIVMAQVRHSRSTQTDTENVTDESGNLLKCKADVHGDPIRIYKINSTLLLADGSLYQGEETESALIHYGEATKVPNPKNPDEMIEAEGIFVIPDSSVDGVPIRRTVKRARIYENLNDDVKPVPGKVMPEDAVTDEIAKHYVIHKNLNGSVMVERMAQITRTDNSTVYAQITWDTIGQVASAVRESGTAIQAIIHSTGELITATWIGTGWMETATPHVLILDKGGKLVFQALSGNNKGEPDLGGLDVFKGPQ